MEKKTEVIPILLELYCDQCNVEMEDNGEVILTNPLKYQYICPNCKKIVKSEESYPRIVYEIKYSQI